jgi:putative transposase
MSQAVSPSAQRRYGLVRVARMWCVARSTVYLQRSREPGPPQPVKKRGPSGGLSDEELLAAIRRVLADWPGGHTGRRRTTARSSRPAPTSAGAPTGRRR